MPLQPPMRWYQTLAWTFFVRQAAAILGLLAIILWVAYNEAERGARTTASASLSAGSYVLERAFEQQGKSMDAGLEVFTQYSGNLALIEHTLESGAPASLADALVENLPRLSAEIALVVKPDGSVLASTAQGARPALPEAGILQMALAPDEARSEGHAGPFYRGFLRVDWGDRPGVYHGVARPLRSPGGRSLGAMLVGIRVDDRAAGDLRRLAIAGPQRGDPTAHLALLSQFRTLGTTLPEAASLDRLLSRDPAFLAVRAQVLDSLRSSVLPFKVGGLNYLGMISPLRGVNALDLEMADVLLMPVDPLLAPFRNLQKAILAVGVGALRGAGPEPPLRAEGHGPPQGPGRRRRSPGRRGPPGDPCPHPDARRSGRADAHLQFHARRAAGQGRLADPPGDRPEGPRARARGPPRTPQSLPGGRGGRTGPERSHATAPHDGHEGRG